MLQIAKKILTLCKMQLIIELHSELQNATTIRLEVKMDKEKLNKDLSDYLKLIRFKCKYSQDEISEKLNVTRQTYTNWENNPIKLELFKLIEIANLMNDDILIFFKEYVAKCNGDN